MGVQKGTINNPNGRTKGSVNKSTSQAREAIARFIDKNTHRLEKWLDEIAEESPKDAFECVMKVMEYHVPKLARQEHVDELGNKIIPNITVQFIGNEDKAFVTVGQKTSENMLSAHRSNTKIIENIA